MRIVRSETIVSPSGEKSICQRPSSWPMQIRTCFNIPQTHGTIFTTCGYKTTIRRKSSIANESRMSGKDTHTSPAYSVPQACGLIKARRDKVTAIRRPSYPTSMPNDCLQDFTCVYIPQAGRVIGTGDSMQTDHRARTSLGRLHPYDR